MKKIKRKSDLAMKKQSKKIFTFAVVVLFLLNYSLGNIFQNYAQAFSQSWDFSDSNDYTFSATEIEISSEQAQLKGASSWYDSDWKYRREITIDNTGYANDLTNYSITISLTSSNFDFSKAQSGGEDLRFIDEDNATVLRYNLSSYDSGAQTGSIFVEVPSISASSEKTIYVYYGNSNTSSYDYFKASIDSTVHNNYGATYPLTYQFSIPAASTDLRAYRRYSTGGSWQQITEKTTNDFFNGIEAVRFDYANDKAYVSVAFSANSDEIQIKITDSSDQTVNASYEDIPNYYDNRDAAVTFTADDWDGDVQASTGFQELSDLLTGLQVWLSPAIIPNGMRKYNHDPAIWSDIQPKVNNGFVEPISHGLEHLGSVYNYSYSGTHTGSDNETTTLTDSTAVFPIDADGYTRNFIGWTIENTTDGSSCVITASTDTTVSCSGGLSGGTDNDWDNGDAYSIDRYDEELGDSKTEITGNLDMPDLNKKSSTEYLYAFAAPYGNIDASIQQKAGENKYLVVRSTLEDKDNFSDATFADGHYTVGGSIWLSTSSVDTNNNKFDSVVAAGGIYHAMTHPSGVNYSAGSVMYQHFNYISGKKNLWYIGFGHLYLYHYLDDRGLVSVSTIGASDGSLEEGISMMDEFSGTLLNTDNWTEEINGGNGTVTVSGGNVTLAPENLWGTPNSAAIRSVENNITRIKLSIKANSASGQFITVSIGSGNVVPIAGSWYNTSLQNGYVILFQSDTDLRIRKMTNGVISANLDTYTTSIDISNFHVYEVIISSSGVSVERDGVEVLFTDDNSYTSGSALISSGINNHEGYSAIVDYAYVSNQDEYADPAKSFSVEQSYYPSTNPTIQPKSTNYFPVSTLISMAETATKNSGEIKYALSNDQGATWLYYNGSNWVSSDSTYSQSNTASEINTNIATFPAGDQKILFKAFLHSDGSQLVQLDNLALNSTPNAPTISTPTALSSSIRWNFTDNSSGETGFKLYDNFDNLLSTEATPNLTYVSETGLSENTQYSGRYVKSYDGDGDSAASSGASATYTLADTPTNLVASDLGFDAATLTVDAFPNATSGSSGYYFYREGDEAAHNSGWIQTNTWDDNTFSCDTNYVWKVKYRNGDGVETAAASVASSEYPNACGTEEDAESVEDVKITKVKTVSTPSEIVITWKTNHNADSYVRYGTNKNLKQHKEETQKERNHKVTLKNLEADTIYYFKIRSTDGDEERDYSRIHSIKTQKSYLQLISSNQNSDNQESSSKVEEIIKNTQEKIQETKNKIENLFSSKIKKIKNKTILSEVKMVVVDNQGASIPNLPVTLHSEPKESITDKNGIATFQDVETGYHTLSFNYQGENYEKKLAISEPKNEEAQEIKAEIITISAIHDGMPMWGWIVWIVLAIVLIGVVPWLIYLVKRKER